MRIAIEGCAHGELDKIYETLGVLEEESDKKIDLLLICGDFQSVRNPTDLECMAVPPKYRTMNTFYKYYSGEKVAPILTIFIGGNHEASNYLSELPYGGWVCPNIYYMGYANVVNVAGIRIAGLSGIYKGNDYLKGHFEYPPYDKSSIKSVYHIRNIDVFRLKLLKNPVDICLSHDWPTSVYNYGNKEELLRYKPFFRDEMESNKLGSPPAEELLLKLKPRYWFSAHLHCKFAAVIPHDDENRPETKFLALDKCLPGRGFLQVLDIDSKSDTVHIEYDPEWLGILKNTNSLLSTSRRYNFLPSIGDNEHSEFSPSDEEIVFLTKLYGGNFKVPENFCVTAPTFNSQNRPTNKIPLQTYINPQTAAICTNLDITDPLVSLLNNSKGSLSISDFSGTESSRTYSSMISENMDEISMNDEDVESEISRNDTDDAFNDDFFIDKVGSQEDDKDSEDFIIDKKGHSCDIIESDDFYIDKIGSHLSAETNDISENITNSHVPCNTPVIENKQADVFPEIRAVNSSADVCAMEEDLAPCLKPFKRRNYDLYKSQGDGENN
ncbi:lariat debranching enzyme [Caerostris darwini]|uniref:Lariat debranching enzyme n=1 Tax=Caerostris darwini TaxID=1538125 RepID=A0AAV4VJW3_9ARAC|nr:lariat debranching enzyme [Caerostris darwini]